ncbi:MAG TPA: PhnD/SsuA/transferrin family substrate-binding protein [Coleofasciculaceae cyanobacterium]|jgi:phosphonate transport system substrate-binding protein
MVSRRFVLLKLLLLLTACETAEVPKLGRLTIGVVGYREGGKSMEQYSAFTNYLGGQLKTLIELEPVYNEVRALEQIKGRVWSLVFAPPGLAAIAISQNQYLPLFPLEGVEKGRSVIVVRQDSPIKKLTELKGKVIALGQLGSATGYYLPIYNLYGLTLAEVRFAPTPKTVLQWIENTEVAAGALSLDELDRYRSNFSRTKFRILAANSVPPGALLVGPMIERNQQEQIRKALASASPAAIAAAGYIPSAKVPDYKGLIEVIEKVKPITKRINEKPARLFK